MVYSTPLDYQFSMPIIEKVSSTIQKKLSIPSSDFSGVLSASTTASASSTSWIIISTIFGITILGLGLMYWYRDVTEQSIGYIEYKINQFFDDWEFSRFWDSQTNTFRTRVVDPSDLLPF